MAKDTKIEVFIDTREPIAAWTELLIPYCHLELQEQYLTCADILVGGIAIERKTATDLLRSLHDGRLFSQIREAKHFYRRYLLLVEGGFEQLSESELSQIKPALLSVAAQWQTPIVRSRDLAHSAAIIDILAMQELMRGRHTPQQRIQIASTDVCTQILQGFNGIGEKRALRLLKKFGTLRAVLSADIQDLIADTGLPESVAKAMLETLDRRYSTE